MGEKLIIFAFSEGEKMEEEEKNLSEKPSLGPICTREDAAKDRGLPCGTRFQQRGWVYRKV